MQQRDVTFKLRRDTAADWATKNPILAAGEPGVETDTHRFKIGDGFTRWLDLDAHISEADVITLIELYGGGGGGVSLMEHILDETPHPVYDDGPSLSSRYQNAKV